MKSIPKKEANASTLPKVCVWMAVSLFMFMLTACHGERSSSALTGSGGASGAGTPSLRVIDTTEHAVVRGRVTDGTNGLPGVRVSAQKSDPGSDKKDQVVVQSMTTTDGNGYYTMYLEPDIYYIVAYKSNDGRYGLSYMGYAKILVEPNTSYTQNFELNSALTGNITSIVTIDRYDADDHVTISFRKMGLPGSSGNEQIEVASLSVTDGVFYTVSLPGGVSKPQSYTVVASTKSDTVTAVASVTANAERTLYIDFPS